jgi:hypothetical protein
LLPVNASFYAFAATALYSIIGNIGLTNKHTLICIAPFIIFPSAALEYAQIHKDVFCTAGFLVSIACIVKLSTNNYSTKAIYLILGNIVALAIIWIFRPYYLIFFILFYILMITFYGTIFLKPYLPRFMKFKNNTELFNNRDSFYKVLYSLVLSFFAIYYSNSHFDLFLGGNFKNLTSSIGVEQATLLKNANKIEIPPLIFVVSDSSLVRDASKAFTTTKSGTLIAKSDLSASSTVDANEVAANGEAANGEAAKEPWFDRMLSKIYVRLAVARRGFITSGVGTAATNIDQHIDFNNINDAIAYIPRALQVSLFAPFPSQWFDFKNRNSSSAEIFLSSAEMIVAYICLAGWLYWLFSLKSISASLLIPSLFCLSILLALGMSVANIGTIYRMRFPFEMVMISFGIAGWIKAIPFLRNFFLKRA